jgi:hypothetical protein
MEDGAAQEACRALRKNSDARTIALATGMMFLSAISADAAGLFHHANVKSGNPLNGTVTSIGCDPWYCDLRQPGNVKAPPN